MQNRLRDPCAASKVLEDHAHERFAPGVRPDIEDLRVHDTLGRYDLAINALDGVRPTVGPPDHEPPGSPHPEVDLTGRQGVAIASSPPLHDVLGRRPCLEHE